jgi:hypothetical protein
MAIGPNEDKMLEALAWGVGGAGAGLGYGLLKGTSDRRAANRQNLGAGMQTAWSGISNKMPMGKTVAVPDPGIDALEGGIALGLTGVGAYGDLNKSFRPQNAVNIMAPPSEPIEGIVTEIPDMPMPVAPYKAPQHGSYDRQKELYDMQKGVWGAMGSGGPSVIGNTKVPSAKKLYPKPAPAISNQDFNTWLKNRPAQQKSPQIMRGPSSYIDTVPAMRPWYEYGGTGGR